MVDAKQAVVLATFSSQSEK